uniref:oxidoreductase n=1 Tax=Pseudonocardia pini TaxID=2758030 RepID=UPI00406BB63C
MLGEPVRVGARWAPSRVLFGPHVTNLGRGRTFSDRHRAYYAERAAGGCGVIVCETASVHPSDHPYARAPVPGWAALAGSCGDALLLGSLGHSGSQGTSAFTGRALWGASRVPDVVTREVPQVMEQPEIEAVVAGFASAAARAVADGLDGVEINAGQHSLLRQFLSGLTNQRADAYGEDRTLLLREVLAAVRAAVGDGIVGLRLCVDELAPWAGITPPSLTPLFPASPPLSTRESPGSDARVGHHVPAGPSLPTRESPTFDARVGHRNPASRPPKARESSSGGAGVAPSAGREHALRPGLADLVDYLVPVRGSGLTVSATRPDLHTPPGFNRDLARSFLGRGVPVVLQGSVVDPAMAAAAVGEGFALVEMTRAQIADPRLVAHVRAGTSERIRPCTLANQHRARDPRNPLV